MSDEHERALEVLREHLATDLEVDVLDLGPHGPLGHLGFIEFGGSGYSVSRVVVTARGDDRVAAVLVETWGREPSYAVAGHYGAVALHDDFDPFALSSGGVSNAELVELARLAEEHSSALMALAREVGRVDPGCGNYLESSRLLTWRTASASASASTPYSNALRGLASGAPLEWVARRFVTAHRPEGDS